MAGPRRRRRRAVPAVLAAAIGLTACGSHAVTRQDVIARGDAICETAFRQAQAVPTPSATSPGALAAYARRVEPIVVREVAALERLPRPAQERSVLDAYLAALRSSASEYATLAAAGTDAGAVAEAESRLAANQAATLALRYGLTACGRSGGTVGSS